MKKEIEKQKKYEKKKIRRKIKRNWRALCKKNRYHEPLAIFTGVRAKRASPNQLGRESRGGGVGQPVHPSQCDSSLFRSSLLTFYFSGCGCE